MLISILLFIAVLSVLVAVHEFGHFIVAKACNIYVDRFSVGMPPRLFGFKWGETDYCIGALPIGGYVKMAGQEDAPLDDETREREYGHVPEDRWFNKKPVWQRVLVLLGGPVANIILAYGLYVVMVAAGSQVPESQLSGRIGEVEPESPAAAAPLYAYEEGKAFADYTGEPVATGWKPGDTILEVDGKPVQNLQDLVIQAVLGGGDATHYVLIERPTPEGQTQRYLSPVVAQRMNDDEPYPRFGVQAFLTPLVGEVLPDTPAAAAGLQAGDVILAANGNLVDWNTFRKTIEDTPNGEPVDLLVKRGDEEVHLSMVPTTLGRLRGVTYGAQEGAADPETAAVEVYAVEPEVRDKTGLQRRDIITKVAGEPITLAALEQMIKDRPEENLALTVERPAILFGLMQGAETLEIELPVDRVSAIGVVSQMKLVPYQVPASEILPEAWRQCWRALDTTVDTLAALLTGNVSPKELGGPIMIAQMTSRASTLGIGYLIHITAFISINLAIFNLLPLPVLDGGQIVVNTIEGIRRKPLPAKFQERFQMVGLVLIISLMLFVTWNDVGRWIDALRP